MSVGDPPYGLGPQMVMYGMGVDPGDQWRRQMRESLQPIPTTTTFTWPPNVASKEELEAALLKQTQAITDALRIISDRIKALEKKPRRRRRK